MRSIPERYRRRATIADPEDEEQVLLGPWEAQVVDVDDPTKRGIIKVIIPVVSLTEPLFAEPILPILGGGKDGGKFGSLFVPPKGSWVHVFFCNGDPEHPRWMAGWFGDDKLPDLLANNYPERRGLVTPSGHALYFDDSDGGADPGSGDVELRHRAGASLVMHDAGDAALSDKNGAKVVLADDASIEATAGHKVTIQAAGGGAANAAARVGDRVVASAAMATWMGQVDAALTTLAGANLIPAAPSPPSSTFATVDAAGGIGSISSGSGNVNIN